MSTERREHLKLKAGRRLATAFRKVLRSSKPVAIDIEMFWPPDHDGVNFLVQADRRDSLDWNFAIPTAHWSIANESHDDLPPKLLADIRAFFRATWNEVRQGTKTDARAYLRLHEDSSAIDLGNGRRINDRDRPDYSEPDRKPFKKPGRSSDVSLVDSGDQEPTCSAPVYPQLGGLDAVDGRHPKWGRFALGPGDSVSITIHNDRITDPPLSRSWQTEAVKLEAQGRYVCRIAAELGWALNER